MLRHSGLAGIAAAVAVVSGVALDAVIAFRFGAGRATDAFFVGARIPLGLQAVILVASNQVLIPRVSSWLHEGSRPGARTNEAPGLGPTRRRTSLLVTAGAAAGMAAAAVLAAGAWPLVRLTAPGLPPEYAGVAATILQIMAFIIPLEVVGGVFEAFLNARFSFVVPSGIKVVRNVAAAVFVLVAGVGGADPRDIAWAYLLGMGLQVLTLFVYASVRGYRFVPVFALRDPDVVATAKLCMRPLAGAAVNPLARIGEQLFVSFLPAGSITLLGYGYRLISAAGGSVFFSSVVVATIPRMTKAIVAGRRAELGRLTRTCVRIMVFVALPLTAVVAVLAAPAITAVFARGKFSAADADLLASIIVVYAASLLGSGMQRGMLAPFFAEMQTRTPLRNTIYGNAANMALIPVFLFVFDRLGVDAVLAVGASYSLAQYIHVGHAWWSLRARLHIRLRGTVPAMAEAAAGSAALAGVLLLLYKLLDLGGDLSRWQLLVRTGVAGMVGLVPAVAVITAMRRLRARQGDLAPPSADPFAEDFEEE
jgi:putative peptidoglycan lipid II flippase